MFLPQFDEVDDDEDDDKRGEKNAQDADSDYVAGNVIRLFIIVMVFFGVFWKIGLYVVHIQIFHLVQFAETPFK